MSTSKWSIDFHSETVWQWDEDFKCLIYLASFKKLGINKKMSNDQITAILKRLSL